MDPISKELSKTAISDKRHNNLTPFPKGVSGNPSGRPKKGEYAKLCEKFAKSRKGRKLIKETMIAILEKKGMAAVLLIREIGERESGKVVQEIDVSGKINTLTDAELVDRLAKLTGSAPSPKLVANS